MFVEFCDGRSQPGQTSALSRVFFADQRGRSRGRGHDRRVSCPLSAAVVRLQDPDPASYFVGITASRRLSVVRQYQRSPSGQGREPWTTAAEHDRGKTFGGNDEKLR